MIRLLMLLCAALFIALLVGGRDHGQMRPGLIATRESAAAPAAMAEPAQPPAATPAAYVPSPASNSRPPNTLPVVLPLVTAPAAERPEAAAETPAIRPDTRPDIRYVTARAVNVRSGPSTGDAVTGRLVAGDTALVLQDTGTGWTHILIEGDGIDGYVATRFLSADAP